MLSIILVKVAADVTEGTLRVVGAFSISLLSRNGLLIVRDDDVWEQVFVSGCKGGIEPISVPIELLLLCRC
eukprot:UN03339